MKESVLVHPGGKEAGSNLLAVSAYESIKKRILNRTLSPGEPLSETKLAEELGMSRTPIRDALGRLRHEGMVNFVPNRGNFVESPTPEDLAEIYDLREYVEGLAAQLLSKRMTEDYAKELRGLAAKADDPLSTMADDAAFHSGIIGMCGSRKVADAYRLLALGVRAYDERTHKLTTRGEVPTMGRGLVPGSHQSLAEKIISGPPKEAEEAAREHVRLGKRTAAMYLLGIEETE